jgi:Response regulators consisting of a CheY-like receiver domain and a winged-helix DNA-binding domain
MHCDTCTNVSVLMELIRKKESACFWRIWICLR